MNLRKLFNLPSEEQSEIIAKEIVAMKAIASKISSAEYSKEHERQGQRDAVCPNCGSKDIVNKITRVQGTGKVSGDLFGFSGYSNTDTNEVNNCNKCGNQWKKYNIIYESDNKILANAFNYIAESIEKPVVSFPEYRQKKIAPFKNFYAESIYRCLHKNFNRSSWSLDGVYSSTWDTLTIKTLRTKYKSIFDEQEK